ncbi:hypothetical protein MalM25_11160 [Planctomycetes bacterium MalM25]|nr:hypothetical protein MalM25_11160 [Planctomycetes bacterium MalM25]
MNQRSSFLRKVVYGVLIAALLFPLSLLSAPATVDSPGGTLAQLRTEHRLSQANLGEIDPASETVKLATLGLRGVAAQFLWRNAMHYKKVEDWTNLTVALEQLAKLQPNFVTFWKFQSWNLSYNVSVEFDDYHDRYYWVRRGIQFLEQGLEYNRDTPALQWEHGWVLGQKIGRADEKVQYRRLFKADDEYHPEDRPPKDRDNWLVSKEAYLESVAAVDERGADLGKKSPSIFYSSAPKSQMNYAEAIEEEGLFDRGVSAWKLAGEEWREFGNVPIEHSTGKILVFNDEDYLAERIEELGEQLAGIVDGVEEQILEGLRDSLTDAQRAAYDKPATDRSEEEYELAYEAQSVLKITPAMIAKKVGEMSPENARRSKELAAELADKEQTLRYIRNYQDTTNYDYWALRCEFEQMKAAYTARSSIYRARRLFREEADIEGALGLYEEGFRQWAKVFEEYPALKDGDGTTGDDVMVYITEYNNVLEQLDEEIGDDFPLWEIIENFDAEQVFALQLRERNQRRLQSGMAPLPTPAGPTPAEPTTDEDGAPAEDQTSAQEEAEEAEDAGDGESPSAPEAEAASESEETDSDAS